METILNNSKKDWLLIILSSAAGFLLVGFYFLLQYFVNETISLLVTLAVYSVFFDIRHLFATYTRTLFDRDFMQSNRKWFLSSWRLIVLIPMILMLIVSYGDFTAYNSQIILSFLTRLTFILGFYHLIKQNWGFIAIYKKKFGEPEDGSDRWDKLMLLSGSFLPFIWISIQYPIWFMGEESAFSPSETEYVYVIAFWQKIAVTCLLLSLTFLLVGFAKKTIPQFKYVSRNLAYLFFGVFLLILIISKSESNSVLYVLLGGFAVIFILSLFMSIQKAIAFGKFNSGKWAVLISSLVLYNGILLLPIEQKYILVMAVTIPHNIQYLSFVKEMNERTYLDANRKQDLAMLFAKKFGLLVIVSALYALAFEGLRTGVKYIPLFNTGDTMILVRNVILVFFIGMVLHHYFLDAVIWRVRKDKNLSEKI